MGREQTPPSSVTLARGFQCKALPGTLGLGKRDTHGMVLMADTSENSILHTDLQNQLVRASHEYSNRTVLRAAIQAIPYIGGPLDVMFAGPVQTWREQRILGFLAELNARVSAVEAQEFTPTPELSEYFITVVEHVARARTQEKRSYFAKLVVNQVRRNRSWDEAESATRLVSELSERDLEVLLVAVTTHPCSGPYDGLRVISLDERWPGDQPLQPLVLRERFPDWPLHALRLSVSGLTARGLLRDEGAGAFDTKAMTYLIVTDLGEWLVEWLDSEQSD